MKHVLTGLAVLGCIGLGGYVYQTSLLHKQVPRKSEEALPLTVQVTRMHTQTVEDRIDLVARGFNLI